MKKYILACCCVLAIAAGCKKNDRQQDVQVQALVSKEVLTSRPDVANPENPFDDAGRLHNEVMDSVWNYSHRTGDTTVRGRQRHMLSFFKERFKTDFADELKSSLETGRKIKQIGLTAFVNESNICEQIKPFILRINAALEQPKKMEDYFTLQQNIVNIEHEIVLSPIPETDKKMILELSSIARYSAFFWKDKLEQYPLEGDRGQKRGFWFWLSYVAADYVGGITGMVVFDPVGEAAFASGAVDFYWR